MLSHTKLPHTMTEEQEVAFGDRLIKAAYEDGVPQDPKEDACFPLPKLSPEESAQVERIRQAIKAEAGGPFPNNFILRIRQYNAKINEIFKFTPPGSDKIAKSVYFSSLSEEIQNRLRDTYSVHKKNVVAKWHPKKLSTPPRGGISRQWWSR